MVANHLTARPVYVRILVKKHFMDKALTIFRLRDLSEIKINVNF